MCPIPLGNVKLPPHLEGYVGAQGLRGISLDCSSFWSDEICFLNHLPLQMKVLGIQGLSAFYS